MITQGFSIGERNWYVMVQYDIWPRDIERIGEVLLAYGCPVPSVEEACEVLSGWNKGYTFSDLDNHVSVICIGRTTSPEQMFDSIMHEVKHLVEHISTFYDLDPKEELSAYLQGEVGRQMFPAAAMVMCPKCNTH